MGKFWQRVDAGSSSIYSVGAEVITRAELRVESSIFQFGRTNKLKSIVYCVYKWYGICSGMERRHVVHLFVHMDKTKQDADTCVRSPSNQTKDRKKLSLASYLITF